MKKLVILKESKIKNILTENLLLDELPSNIKKHLSKNKTSLGKHPSFPGEDEVTFDRKLTIKRYKEVRDAIMDLELSDLSEEGLSRELSILLKKCRNLEIPIRENLEKICYNTIVTMFAIPEGIINYSCQLVDKVEENQSIIRLTPEEDDETEFDDIIDFENTGEEVYKRRLINALVMGAAMNYTTSMAKQYIGEIFELNPKLPELYSKILKINNYLMFIKNEIELKDKKRMQGGVVNVILGNEEIKSEIKAEALIFPILLAESIRGFMELFASHGLPKSREKSKYVLKKADFLLAEPWDMRLGPVLWNMLTDTIENDDSTIIPNVFTSIIELPPNEFHKLMKEVFAKTKLGRQQIQNIVQGVLHDMEYEDFETSLDTKRADIGVIEDDYIQPDELISPRIWENKILRKEIIKECLSGCVGFEQPKNGLYQALEYFGEKEGTSYNNPYEMAKDFLEWIGPGKYTDFEIKQLEKHCERFLNEIKYPNEVFWDGGAKVEFDDCVKLNNNKEAQNGRASQGAVDGVVKLVKENSENVFFDRIKLSLDNITTIITNALEYNDEDIYPKDNDDEWLSGDDSIFSSEEEFLEECYHIGNMFNGMPDLIPIWRTIHVEKLSKIRYDDLGESWSFERNSAIRFGDQNIPSPRILFKAHTPFSNVDWEETIYRYAINSLIVTNDPEDELVIINTNQLKKVEIEDKDGQITEGKHKEYGGLKWLEDNEIPLTDEEKSYFRKHKVTWGKTETGEIVVKKAKAKDEKDGEVYFAKTHRAWGVKPTKSEAVKMGKFIESTS